MNLGFFLTIEMAVKISKLIIILIIIMNFINNVLYI